MSYQTFFLFSAGLAATIKVPKGTKKEINAHIEKVESTLKITREKYRDNPSHWKSNDYSDIDKKVLCKIAEEHNRWVRWFHGKLEEWYKNPPEAYEELTGEYFQKVIPALIFITVPADRWTADYYRARMEALYKVMRGRETDGVSFDARKLTEKQAAAVIVLFSEFLDPADLQLDVPMGCDYLASLYYGEYEWCERCGAVTPEHAESCKRRKCPVREND